MTLSNLQSNARALIACLAMAEIALLVIILLRIIFRERIADSYKNNDRTFCYVNWALFVLFLIGGGIFNTETIDDHATGVFAELFFVTLGGIDLVFTVMITSTFVCDVDEHNFQLRIQEARAEETSFAELIPAYEGDPSTALGSTSGLDPFDAPNAISPRRLDYLDRPFAIEMSVTSDTLPADDEKAKNIGSFKPTGWHTVRDDSIDGCYLYNRCSLVAWYLSGLNPESGNLITGTRYMNVEGMLPYETLVAEYVKKSDGSVYYRVTPDFRDDDLIVRGVRIQALSLEDGGGAVNLDVYCYNVQPGYEIDYATGEATPVS